MTFLVREEARIRWECVLRNDRGPQRIVKAEEAKGLMDAYAGCCAVVQEL